MLLYKNIIQLSLLLLYRKDNYWMQMVQLSCLVFNCNIYNTVVDILKLLQNKQVTFD